MKAEFASTILIIGSALALVACNRYGGARNPIERLEWVEVPAGKYLLGSKEDGAAFPPTLCELDRFAIMANEVTVALYCYYLNSTGLATAGDHPQVEFTSGEYVPARKSRNQPLAHVSYSEAVDFCRWLSQKLDADIRLPTELEWEAAARGGIGGGRYPWGWGAAVGRAAFAHGSATKGRRFQPNGYGLYDMAGSLFEWCIPVAEYRAGRAPIRGGSWNETDQRFLRVFNKMCADVDYRDADVGFRAIMSANPRPRK